MVGGNYLAGLQLGEPVVAYLLRDKLAIGFVAALYGYALLWGFASEFAQHWMPAPTLVPMAVLLAVLILPYIRPSLQAEPLRAQA